MDLALYHPERGYYRGPTVRSAREGDFLTAPELHAAFGQALARQLAEMWELLERPDRFSLRDYGAGTGTLGLTVVEALRTEASPLFGVLRYQPVEINRAHQRTLAHRFAAAGLTDRLDWQPAPDSPGAAPTETPWPTRGGSRAASWDRTPLVGCVVANEFVDALPVHRVEGTGGRMSETFVAWQDDWFAEEAGELSAPELAAYFEALGIALEPGQRAEVNLAMGRWLDEVAADLQHGYVLVIDYGHLADELFSADRTDGTLRAYRGHTAHGDPFRFVGRQDLTAHVDFTTLGRWARERGLESLAFTTQARFLVAAGLEQILVAERDRADLSAEDYVALRASIVRLLDPRALGGFRVLLLGRNVPSDRLPSGFQDRGIVPDI